MTYSLVARDPETGDLGVAVQSHFFSVGTVVAWAESGVGAVATQAFVRTSYGPRGLELMRAGRSAAGALGELRRLVGLRRAYDHMGEGEKLAMGGDLPASLEHYERAHAAAPDNLEIAFWLGLALAGSGKVEEARAHIRRASAADPGWDE